MGEAYRKVNFLPALGKRLVKLQREDFEKCIEYYRGLKVHEDVFTGHSKSLVRCTHKIAFTMDLWVQKLSGIPAWALPYLHQLKSDAIQLIPSVILGDRRTLHLYERASIEDFLRYIYFFDHQVEHILLQTHPKRFQSFDFLIDWVKAYPNLAPYEELVSESCNNLTSKYSELSRTIHGTTIVDLQLSNSLKALNKPIERPVREMNTVKSIFRSVFFLLSLFHLQEFRQFSLDERGVICQHLVDKEKQALSGIDTL